MPAAAPAVLLLSLDTQQGVSNIILAMTRRDFGKPAFSLRKKRFVKTHALSLLGTTRLLSRSERLVAAADGLDIHYPGFRVAGRKFKALFPDGRKQLGAEYFRQGFVAKQVGLVGFAGFRPP